MTGRCLLALGARGRNGRRVLHTHVAACDRAITLTTTLSSFPVPVLDPCGRKRTRRQRPAHTLDHARGRLRRGKPFHRTLVYQACASHSKREEGGSSPSRPATVSVPRSRQMLIKASAFDVGDGAVVYSIYSTYRP